MGTATRSECELDQIRNEKGQIVKGFNGEFDTGGRECDRRSGAESESGGGIRPGAGEGESLAGGGHCGCCGEGESLAGGSHCRGRGGGLSCGGCVHRIERGGGGSIGGGVCRRVGGGGSTFRSSRGGRRCGDSRAVICGWCCRSGSGRCTRRGISSAVSRRVRCSVCGRRDRFGHRGSRLRRQRRGAGRCARIRLHHVQSFQFQFQCFADADPEFVSKPNSNSGPDAYPHADACIALFLGRTC